MFAIKVLYFSTAVISAISASPYLSCVIPVVREHNNWPLIFKTQGTLFPTTDDYFYLAPNEKYLISCSPFKIREHNNIKNNKNAFSVTLEGQCQDRVIDSHPSIVPSDFCEKNVIGEVEIKNEVCGNQNGRFLMYGFQNPFTQKPFLFGSVCIDKIVGFAKHIRALINISQMKEIPIPTGVNPNTKISHISGDYDFQLYDIDRYQKLVKEMKSFMSSEQYPRFKIINLLDEKLLGNGQFLGIKHFKWNHILIPEENKVFGLVMADLKNFAKDRPYFVEFNMTGVYTLQNSRSQKLQLYVEGEVGKKYPVPEKLIIKLDDIKAKIVYEFTIPLQGVIEDTNKCKEIAWLINTKNSTNLKNHLNCNILANK